MYQQRPDGLWLTFATGEEAGPFVDEGEAEAFLVWAATQRGN